MRIKQGDQYAVPVELLLNGEPIVPEDIAAAEFYLGGFRKLYPGAVSYDPAEGIFYVPITQEESLSWAEGESIILDIRVRFTGGDVQGIEKQIYVGVTDAVSEEVL